MGRSPGKGYLPKGLGGGGKKLMKVWQKEGQEPRKHRDVMVLQAFQEDADWEVVQQSN